MFVTAGSRLGVQVSKNAVSCPAATLREEISRVPWRKRHTSIDDNSAWDEIRVDLLQRALINHDGSSVTSMLEAPREAQFELADAFKYGRFWLGEYALKACA